MRVIRACKELGLKTVAVYSVADKDCLHVQVGDALCLLGRRRWGGRDCEEQPGSRRAGGSWGLAAGAHGVAARRRPAVR